MLIEEPLYQWIKASWWSQPRWNFYVYWFNQSGELIQCWKPWQLFSGYRAERSLSNVELNLIKIEFVFCTDKAVKIVKAYIGKWFWHITYYANL